MTLYSEYVNNFPKSIAVINKYTRNSHKFKRFLEVGEEVTLKVYPWAASDLMVVILFVDIEMRERPKM